MRCLEQTTHIPRILDSMGIWHRGIWRLSNEASPDEDCMHGLFKAEYTCKYLEDYADYFVIAGRSLRDRIMFNTHLDTVEKSGDGRWSLLCTDLDGKINSKTISTASLMMANGQDS